MQASERMRAQLGSEIEGGLIQTENNSARVKKIPQIDRVNQLDDLSRAGDAGQQDNPSSLPSPFNSVDPPNGSSQSAYDVTALRETKCG